MKSSVETVDDTIANQEICRKYCGNCPTFRGNRLSDTLPNALFCARGRSPAPSKIKPVNCYCPACEVFTKYKLNVGYFCINK